MVEVACGGMRRDLLVGCTVVLQIHNRREGGLLTVDVVGCKIKKSTHPDQINEAIFK